MRKAGLGLFVLSQLILSLAPVPYSQLEQKAAELVHGFFQNLEITIGTFLPYSTTGLFSRVTRVRVCARWMRWLRGRGWVRWDGREASGEWKRREIGPFHAIKELFLGKSIFFKRHLFFDPLPDSGHPFTGILKTGLRIFR